MEFGEKVQRLIDRDGWPSVRSIATKAGVDDSTLDRSVKRGGSMSVEKALLVARALDVPVEWLFDSEKGWPPPPALDVPPIAIIPWPPQGITWPEVRLAIAEFMARKAARDLPSPVSDRVKEVFELIETASRMGDYQGSGEELAVQLLDRAKLLIDMEKQGLWRDRSSSKNQAVKGAGPAASSSNATIPQKRRKS